MSQAIPPLGNFTKFNSESVESDKNDIFRQKLSLLGYAQKHLPNHRIRVCFNHIQHKKESVDIYTSESGAKYKNLMVCDNVWTCPICSSRIMLERSKELRYVITQAQAESYHLYMMTFTLKHSIYDTAESLFKRLKKAYALFWGGREGVRLKSELGYKGSVKGFEVRYGFTNGYHPHIHLILMLDKPLPQTIAKVEKNRDSCLPSIENTFKNRWIDSLNRVGGSADYESGLDIKDSCADMFKYLTKASELSCELTHGNIKESRSSYSMMQLLELAYTENDSHALNAWLEYTEAIKGTNALVYSDGLKELSDSLKAEESAKVESVESMELYAKLPKNVWLIVRRGGIEVKSRILSIAKNESVYHLALYLHQVLGVNWLDAISIYPPLTDNSLKSESVMAHYPHIERKKPITIMDYDLIF